MKTKNFIAGIGMSYFMLLLTALSVSAQQPNVSLSDQMDNAIANLDFTEVTSGLLLDRGFQTMNVVDFDGSTTSDTLFQYGDWFRQYGTMVTSKVNSTSPLGETADWKPQSDVLLKNGVVPIHILHAEYQKLLEDSVMLTSLFTEQNGQLYDVPNRTTSPYTTHEVFSFSPKKTIVDDSLSQNFRIDTDFFRSNTAKTVGSIAIDFDNGSGYQTMTFGADKKISWSTHGKKFLTLKITYTDNSIYYAKAIYEIVDKTGAQPKYYGVPDQEFHVDHPSIANHGALVTIEYGCGNTELRKPFIYVEGFNPDQFGNQHYSSDFYEKFDDYAGTWPTGFPLLDELDENGYDVVYIDFDRGAGDLKENAQTVREVIKELNLQKAANSSSSPNILVGYSMGGVVARLALTYMEDANETHEVSYYVSVDAPHLGANVPRGIIAALINIRNFEFSGFSISEDVPSVESAYQVLDSPAAKQMLIYSGEGSNTLVTGSGPSHVAFMAHLDAQQMPTETMQNIAVSKGNGSGVGQGYGSLEPIMNVNINFFNALSCLTDVPDVAGWMAGAFALIKLGLYGRVHVDINSMAGNSSQAFHIYHMDVKIIIVFVQLHWFHDTKAQNVHFYDGVQGGSYGIGSYAGLEGNQFINDLVNGIYQPCAKLHQTKTCFVPTVSALNISGMLTTPSYPIDTQAIVDNDETPFDKAYVLDPSKYPPATAPNNESHLDLTPSNVFPFSLVIPPDFNAVNENPTVHGYTFNFGYAEVNNEVIQTTDRITHPLTVSGLSSANGALWINRDARLENKNDQNNPFSTSDHFSVELRESCDETFGRVTVESLGSIVIGEDDQKKANVIVRNNAWIKMNDGFIEVRNGSKLIIEDGGELRLSGGLLRIQDGGEVIIKSGGKLIYEAGTQIELNGNDAVLSLGGLTHIGDDATFTFTYQGTESGYIRMLEEGFSQERFSAGSGAQVKLEGKDKNDLILYLEEDVDFWEFDGSVPGENYDSEIFKYVEFKNGKILMEDEARIVLLNDSRFIRCLVEPVDGTHTPRGIVPLTFCDITNSTLNHTKVDAQLYYLESGFLYITDSELNYSDVQIRGYGYKARFSEFNSTPLSSTLCTMSNSIVECKFTNLSEQTAVSDDSNTELYIYKSEFDYTRTAVMKLLNRVTVKCSEFENNETAIYGADGSTVNISTLYNGGYNYFDKNDYNIYLSNAYGLDMEDGYNEFYDADIMNVEGTLDLNWNPCPPAIDADNNTWTPLSDNSVPNSDPNHPDVAEFDVRIIGTGGVPQPVYCYIGFNFGHVAPITSCGEYDDPKDPKDENGEGPKSNEVEEEFPLINTPIYFTDTPFDYAMKVAAFSTSIADTVNGNDMIAADKYYELLYLAEMDSVPSDSLALVIEKMRWSSLNNYKATIERLFADSLLLRSNNQNAFEPTVQNYVTVLINFTDSIKTAENYNEQFQLELWKASLMSTIGKKDKALQLVSNINFCDHDSLQKIILLQQIQNLEFDIARSQISTSDFLQDSITFVLDSSIYQIPLESYIDTSGFGSYIMSPNSILYSSCNTFLARQTNSNGVTGVNAVLYPNPAQDQLTISILNSTIKSEDNLVLHIYELTGKEIFNTQLKSQTVRVDLPDLANALYIYHLELNDKIVDQGKISIAK